ncbi:Transducer of Cdc42-dependent actin assembly protein 2 homolog [Caenorhabditis elegans]|uniref:Transducer of Cdc42-dependent actin assembly protein 2 homolog n=1 Tax=Caenorhabditis elegans TaxID=6239 RepID=TOCA2_CAEEL|nr:Transducer of Cdc42-dependent actin assembly protein 2 homolog [Caenorhabditis elegans]Q9XUS7.2 RecName: Full=Transducer of Cdc42-dependent actin assembly protein 2 homolog [Caenorhabditis elegans]CAB04595.2 Transducer of Cdc42-dependent actin assembly protein 2 homolog [Caenorhabditis elegans]|eukprot:NP_499838.2 Transducer of Cdc42-dependent actin assembly protein 2 homolog [Caenorhabditis elegans]
MIPVSRFFTVQDPSNALLSYTQKGIDFFEKLGQFSKEKAAIEEEYSTKLRSLAKKYAKKSEEDDEILKSVSYTSSFNSFLQQLDQIATRHQTSAEHIRGGVVSYVASKTCQMRSSRKNAINDLKTINDKLEDQINEMCKSGKCYLKSFKDAENSYQKFYKADKNLEISRLELEKARALANARNEACELAKQDYSALVRKTNAEQKRYHVELLPVIFARLKAVDKECIADMRQVLQKIVSFDDSLADSTEECRKIMQREVGKIDAEGDAQLVLKSVEATIEQPAPFEIEDLGDPKNCDSRTNDSADGSGGKLLKSSPSKNRIIRNFLGILKEKEADEKPEASNNDQLMYTDKSKPAHVRLSCLRSKIRDMEKQLEQAIQGREGITRLQQAYYTNPQHGNPSACTEPLISYAKKIEKLKMDIHNLKEFYAMLEMSVEEGQERSFGGRDTPDTTRSMSGSSTNQSSSKTIEDVLSGEAGNSSSADDSSKNILRQLFTTPKRLISSPKTSKSSTPTPLRRRAEISSPKILRSSFSGAIRKSLSTPDSVKVETAVTVTALFEFAKSSAETMSIEQGEILLVLEHDHGDGWTRTKNCRKHNEESGFVPTSYLQFPQ